ncbi:hypothetical protein B5F07_19440, partial [Lachnoclostridium sp. An169]
MNRAHKFRIYPTGEQEILINKTFGCCRFVYNHMLADKKQAYEETKQMRKITPAAYKKESPWLKEVDSLALANEQLHLECAYRKFFREPGTGFPKFKSKHGSRKSYTTNVVNGNSWISEGRLRLPKVGKVKIRQHREIPAGWQSSPQERNVGIRDTTVRHRKGWPGNKESCPTARKAAGITRSRSVK